MGIPRDFRFHNRNLVRQVLNHGRRFETPLGRVTLLLTRRDHARVLFVVSTRVSKLSTRRHAIKRRLDEWARVKLAPLKGNLVVHVRPEAGAATRGELLRLANAMRDLLPGLQRARTEGSF